MKRLFTILFLTCLVSGVSAQNYELYPDSTYTEGAATEFELVGHAWIKNVQGDTNFTWKRIENTLATDWESAICDQITCWSPGVDRSTLVISEGDSSILDAHFYMNNAAGMGVVRVAVWAGSDSANADTVEYHANTWPLSVSRVKLDKPMKVYPNPTQGVLNLEFDANGTAEVEIFDVLGKKVKGFSYSGRVSALNLHDLQNGLYIIRVTENGKVYSRSFRKVN